MSGAPARAASLPFALLILHFKSASKAKCPVIGKKSKTAGAARLLDIETQIYDFDKIKSQRHWVCAFL